MNARLEKAKRIAMPPLNGEKTHPLKPASLDMLAKLMRRPIPRGEINPGVANRLEREALVEEYWDTSPYRSHKGAKCAWIRITDAGRDEHARHVL